MTVKHPSIHLRFLEMAEFALVIGIHPALVFCNEDSCSREHYERLV